jgi:hypothetical protein
MPTIQQTLQQVPILNTGEQPFIFQVLDNTIVGKWDITNSRWFAPLGITDIFQKYSLTVVFDEAKGTFTFRETKAESENHIGISFCEINLGSESNTFSGKMNQKSLRIGVGGEKDGSNGVGLNTVKFDTKTIKTPMRGFLEAQGWKMKKGFLSGLFG